MSKSNRFNDFIGRNPGTEEYVVNAEFVMKQIDKALDGHAHSGTDSPLIDQSVTLDFATHGGTIYVRTPAVSSGQGVLPDTSGLGDFYTKTAIDSKLAGKSDTGHTHTKSNITDRLHQKILSVSCSLLYIMFSGFVLVFRGSLIIILTDLSLIKAL